MKKLGLLVMPLMAVSLLMSCNEGGDNPGPEPEKENPLTITCTSGTLNLGIYSAVSGTYEETSVNIKWKKNNDDWKDENLTIPSTGTMSNPSLLFTISLNKNESASFMGDNPSGFSFKKESGFSRTIAFSNPIDEDAEFKASGNIMSLIDLKNYKTIEEMPSEECFKMFFIDSKVTDASKLVLPCDKLTNSCYYEMFGYCSSLVNAPELPATTLAYECYYRMFGNCSSLVNAPELPATTLADSCYIHMFEYCSSLNYLKVGFGDSGSIEWPAAPYFTITWLYSVSTTGTFIWKGSSEGPQTRTDDTVPSGWTIETY